MIDDRPRRLGRLHHDPQALAQAPHLADHRFAAMAPARAVDRQAVAFQPRMFSNDTLPVCTCAALANAALAVSALNGFQTLIVDSAVPALYAACVGMPGASSSELAGTAGAVAIDVLRRQVTAGFDVGEETRLVGLFGTVPLDRARLATGIARLGVGYWGVRLHARDMDAAGSNVPWDDDHRDPGPLEGGHMLNAWDYTGLGDTDLVRLATWGGFKSATWRWVKARLDEAYGLVWRQLARTDGRDLGVNIAALEAALRT